MYNHNPMLIFKDEAEEMISKIAAERALAIRAKDVPAPMNLCH